MYDPRFKSKKTFILFYILVSFIAALIIICCPVGKAIMSAYEKVSSNSSKDFLVELLDLFPPKSDNLTEEKIIILCPDLGGSIDDRKATRESVLDILKTIIPFHPAVVAVDVLFDRDDDFLQVDSLCAYAKQNGVELVLACRATDTLVVHDPDLYGYVDCYEEDKNRFVPVVYNGLCSFPHLILQKEVGHSVDVPKGLIINPKLAHSNNREYSSSYVENYLDELKGQTVLLGVDYKEDSWAIDGEQWSTRGIELHRATVNTLAAYLKLPSRRIPVLAIIVVLFFWYLVYAKVFKQDKSWGRFFARFYDCFILVIPIILFVLFLAVPSYPYNILFWKICAFLLIIEIPLSTFMYPFLPKEEQ